MVVILLSLAAAVGYAVSSVVQQRAASAQPRQYALRATLLLRLVRQPLWLAGKAADVVATILQAIAIHLGSLVLVEPLLASGLLFALPLGAIGSGQRLRRRDWLGALALAGGLAVFMLVTPSTGGRSSAPLAVWCVAGSAVAVVASVLGALSGRHLRHRPALLAAAGGLLYACTAALTKPVTRAWSAGALPLASSWELYTLLAVSLVAALAVQTAFQTGSVTASLPALTAIEPVAGVALGVWVFREHLSGGPLAAAPLLAAVTVMLAGIIVLARSPLAGGAGSMVPPVDPQAMISTMPVSRS